MLHNELVGKKKKNSIKCVIQQFPKALLGPPEKRLPGTHVILIYLKSTKSLRPT
jgi:hypothetical protein